ncbi:MAG: HAD-IIA family hydrolase [Anaerolineae bacterium]|nr:MAG: HAD-IIA family hydrolase [Anaerolineae bacterium]
MTALASSKHYALTLALTILYNPSLMTCIDLKITDLILDMDGVLWRGETPMPGLVDFFDTLNQLGVDYVLATNNATKTAEMYANRLAGFGVEISKELILNSAEATARYLRHNFPKGETAYIIGEKGLFQAMTDQGFHILNGESFVGSDARAEFVVVGFTRYVCYPQLASAAYLINNGAQFIGTNPDVSIPTEHGPLPGAGSLLAYLEAATGQTPLVIGKPNLPLFQEALHLLGNNPQTTAIVGDRLATDIAGGHAAGLKTILLLSGITREKDVQSSSIHPDCIMNDINELAAFLTAQ